MSQPDPALVQAARAKTIDLWDECPCPKCLSGDVDWGCLPDRIAAFGAEQRACVIELLAPFVEPVAKRICICGKRRPSMPETFREPGTCQPCRAAAALRAARSEGR